ncbi:MAG: hypothetical protein RLZZ437_1555 [Pseudomonadota bacterium]|jgi:multidrug efflux pump subunit AcrA (membrane-fusion protein)
MLGKLDAVYMFAQPDVWSVVFGPVPEAAQKAELAKTAQERPAARKINNAMVITVPLASGRWMLWLLSEIPPVNELAAVMARLQDLSRGLDRLQPHLAAMPESHAALATDGGVQGAKTEDRLAGLMGRLRVGLGDARYPKQTVAIGALLDLLVEEGIVNGGAVIEFTAKGVARHWLSDNRYRSHAAELRLVAQSLRDTEPRSVVVPAVGEDAKDLEAALLARQFDATSLAFVVPAADVQGYGICAFGAKDDAVPLLQAAVDMASMIVGLRSPASVRRLWLRRGVLAAVLGATAIWLALPAPLAITASGEAAAADQALVTVPSDAFLKKVHVRAGDAVSNGSLIAELDSPSLQNMLAEERLNATVEALNGQAALAENRYADYQISVERLAIIETRIAQISDRIAALRIVAMADGRVIEALPDNVTGAFVRTGDRVAAIQTTDAMRMTLSFARMDARLITPGMTGEVYFRGLAGRTYALRILTPATVRKDPQGQFDIIEAVAEVEAPEGVIAGMTGVATLDGPDGPRIVSYGRYAYEFIRKGAWTYLGLKF